jgi:hypothetical protein
VVQLLLKTGTEKGTARKFTSCVPFWFYFGLISPVFALKILLRWKRHPLPVEESGPIFVDIAIGLSCPAVLVFAKPYLIILLTLPSTAQIPIHETIYPGQYCSRQQESDQAGHSGSS